MDIKDFKVNIAYRGAKFNIELNIYSYKDVRDTCTTILWLLDQGWKCGDPMPTVETGYYGSVDNIYYDFYMDAEEFKTKYK